MGIDRQTEPGYPTANLPSGGWHFWLAESVSFFIHQSLAAWGATLAAPWALIFFGEVAWHLGWRTRITQTQWVLYGTPYFPAQISLALVVGWVVGGTLRHRSMLWVWVLPLLALCSAAARFPRVIAPPFTTVLTLIVLYPVGYSVSAHSGNLGVATILSHFFGWGRGFQPYDQVLLTVPFYAAVAYSAGAFLARKVLRAPRFFDTMRRLRVKRLMLFVSLPWFCIKAALEWQQTAARLPAFHTWLGLRFFLQGLMIMSVFITFVFSAVVGLAGRRLSLTRFFIKGCPVP